MTQEPTSKTGHEAGTCFVWGTSQSQATMHMIMLTSHLGVNYDWHVFIRITYWHVFRRKLKILENPCKYVEKLQAIARAGCLEEAGVPRADVH